MRYPVRFLLFVVFLLSVLPFDVSALRVDQIPDLVSEKNRELAASGKEIDAAESSVSAAYGRYFPSLSLKNTYVHLGADIQLKVPAQSFTIGATTISVDLPPVQLQAADIFLSSFVLGWPLFTGGRITAGVSAARAEADEARAERDKLKLEKTQEAVTRYFSVQLARRVVAALAEVKTTIERLREIAQGLQKTGLGTKFFVLQIESTLADVESKRVEAIGKSRLADLAFHHSVGVPTVEPIEYETPIPVPELPTDRGPLADLAHAKRAEFQILSAKDRQVGALRALHLGEMLPALYGLGTYNVLTANLPLLEPRWAIGLVLNIPLTSWATAGPEHERALRLAEKVEITRRRAEEEIPLQLEKLWVSASALHASLESAEAGIAAATEARRLSEIRFKNGDGAAVETLQAHAEWERAEIRRWQLKEEYNRSILDLYAAAGDLSPYFRGAAEANQKGVAP